MRKIELLAPAGSMEAAIAAVRSGADAIYLGFGDFNARRNAKNFSAEEMAEVVSYCRARGVKTHITLNTVLNDREFSRLADTINIINDVSPDAVIVSDLGVANAVRSIAPDICLHASTQLTIHNIDGARAAKELGFSRVVLSRELSRDAICKITNAVDIETEVFVHGALCMCYSGQCYMSSFIGKRSGNRGLCAQPCRLPYKVNSSQYSHPLSLRDLCLAGELSTLRELGVASLKIEGRMKRPEYVAVVCDIYSRLLREERAPTEDELCALNEIFSRDGFTDGYFNSRLGADMFGTRSTEPSSPAIYKDAERLYSSEKQTVPVDFSFKIERNSPISLNVSDISGNNVYVEGAVPEDAKTRAIDAATIADKLSKTGGTPFFADNIAVLVDDNLSVPISAINNLRREALDELYSLRAMPPKNSRGTLTSIEKFENKQIKPSLVIQLQDLAQMTDELLTFPIERIYLPLDKLKATPDFDFGVVLPQIIWDFEWVDILNKLDKISAKHVLVSNIGHARLLLDRGFTVEGDIGLNIFNSRTLSEYKKLGLSCATLSPELKFAQIRDISKCIPTELVVYGHLPLMVTENCAVSCRGCKSEINYLTDRYGVSFPVLCLPQHRSLILNSDVLYLADKACDLNSLGLSRLRLNFTIEDAQRVLAVTKEYLYGAQGTPSKFTRGLYRRGVE